MLDRELVIADSVRDVVLWVGMPDGHPVEAAWPIPATPDALVLLAYMSGPQGAFRNLVRVNPSGRVIWRAELPSSGNNAYVSAEVRADGVIAAHSWSAHLVQIDPATGHLIDTEFVK